MHVSKIRQEFLHWWSTSIRYLFSFTDFVYDKLHLVKQWRLTSPDMFLLTCMGHMHVILFVGKRVKIVSWKRDVGSPQESKDLHWDLLVEGFFRAWALLIVHARCQGLFSKWDSLGWDKALTTGPELCDVSPIHPYLYWNLQKLLDTRQDNMGNYWSTWAALELLHLERGPDFPFVRLISSQTVH